MIISLANETSRDQERLDAINERLYELEDTKSIIYLTYKEKGYVDEYYLDMFNDINRDIDNLIEEKREILKRLPHE